MARNSDCPPFSLHSKPTSWEVLHPSAQFSHLGTWFPFPHKLAIRPWKHRFYTFELNELQVDRLTITRVQRANRQFRAVAQTLIHIKGAIFVLYPVKISWSRKSFRGLAVAQTFNSSAQLWMGFISQSREMCSLASSLITDYQWLNPGHRFRPDNSTGPPQAETVADMICRVKLRRVYLSIRNGC